MSDDSDSGGCGCLILIIVLVFIALLSTKMKKEKDTLKEHIGDKIIMQKDTLTVVDYSYLSYTYTLSNGTKIDCSLYEKIKIK